MSVAQLIKKVTPKQSKGGVSMMRPLLKELVHLCVDRNSCDVEAQIRICVQKLNLTKR